jgi:hypothetical protein
MRAEPGMNRHDQTDDGACTLLPNFIFGKNMRIITYHPPIRDLSTLAGHIPALLSCRSTETIMRRDNPPVLQRFGLPFTLYRIGMAIGLHPRRPSQVAFGLAEQPSHVRPVVA